MIRVVLKGGEGSGNFGHAGRPGKIGGSAKKYGQAVLMRTAKLTDTDEEYNRGSFASKRANIEGDGKGIVKYDFAPSSSAWANYITKGYARREEMAWQVSRLLGLDNVPITVLRKENDQIISVQSWVNDAMAGFHARSASDEEFGKMLLLDFIIGNIDRHPFNVLVKDGKIYAIDNGAALLNDTESVLDFTEIHDMWLTIRNYRTKEKIPLSRVFKDRLANLLHSGKLERLFRSTIPKDISADELEKQNQIVAAALTRVGRILEPHAGINGVQISSYWDMYFKDPQ